MLKAQQTMSQDGPPTTSPRRAGQYLPQPTGYRAFIPAPLPPDPPINLSGDLQVLLSQADRALGRLDGSIKTLPNPDLFVFMYVRKEAVLSSQIEGTQSSLQDVLDAEAKILAADRPQDAEEVVNYVRAMNHGMRGWMSSPSRSDSFAKSTQNSWKMSAALISRQANCELARTGLALVAVN